MICCDTCGDWYHGKCVNISQDGVPETWECSRCFSKWPKARNLFLRLKSLMDTLQHRKGIRKSEVVKQRKLLIKQMSWSKLEKTNFQRAILQYGTLRPWSELQKMGLTLKTTSQIEEYFYSFMQEVEYLVKVDVQKTFRKKVKSLKLTGKRPTHICCNCKQMAGTGLMVHCLACQHWF